jgi:hypothetical protein
MSIPSSANPATWIIVETPSSSGLEELRADGADRPLVVLDVCQVPGHVHNVGQ